MLWKLINPITTLIAASPFHFLISNNILVLKFSGHRTGRRYAIPVSYHEDRAGILNCLTESSNIWWRNLRFLDVIKVCYKGKLIEAQTSIEVGDIAAIKEKLQVMCLKSRVDGYFAKVGYENGEPIASDLLSAAKRMVLIRIDMQI